MLLSLDLSPALASRESALTRFTTVRFGTTSKGATRVVFELEAPVEFFSVEPEGVNGLDIHLLRTDYASAPAPLRIANGAVEQVTFRDDPSGTVARIVGSGADGAGVFAAKVFTLTNPARVVVDISPGPKEPSPRMESTGGSVTEKAPNVEPKLPAANPPTKSGAGSLEPEKRTEAASPTSGEAHSKKESEAKSEAHPKSETHPSRHAKESPGHASEKGTIFEEATPSAVSVHKPAEGSSFDGLVSWIHVLKAKIDALNTSESEEDRARYRRSLAFLLAERGLLVEAEKALASALESESRNPETASADSIYLAELRFKLGDQEGAAAIVRALPTDNATPARKQQLAEIMVECDLAPMGIELLKEAIPGLGSPARARAQLSLAKALWRQGDLEEALSHVKPLTGSLEAPEDVLPRALVLHADCLWALGRVSDAKDLYQRASGGELPPEEASWTTLQLGNLARREGRFEDAKSYYRDAMARWPSSFYASQADWFLRISEEVEKLEKSGVVDDRG
jgi:tetratricopeptide (TPR) repeat protein